MTKIKVLLFVIFVFICHLSFVICHYSYAEVNASFWQTEKSDHFIIYYQVAPPGFVSELKDTAERYYNGIVDDLNFRRFDFWNWDKRAKIFLYDNDTVYHNETKNARWSGAAVIIKSRTIKSYVGQAGFFDGILPHEMTHIIFREFIGEKVELPLWLDEGIACSEEKTSLAVRLQLAKGLIEENKYKNVEEFSSIRDPGSVSPQDFYAQAASLVNFLKERYGKEAFLDFSRALRDGKAWKEALLDTYRFSDLSEFEQEWKYFSVR